MTLKELIKHEDSDFFAITPFKLQGENFQKEYSKESCGTIHTFQGREEKKVYFSAVLNDLPECVYHIKGNHNLFSPSLINVAVSRAINKFILVSDIDFFNKNNCELTNLINYINVYGKEVADKTSSIFDYLYKQIKTFKKSSMFDSVWEKQLKQDIDKYLLTRKYFSLQMKQYVSSVVNDFQYLNENIKIKNFIMNGAHIDFLIYDNRIGKPILAIELDGKEHDKPEQKVRDAMKDDSLKHMNIKIWRLRSKTAISQKELFIKLDELLKENQI